MLSNSELQSFIEGANLERSDYFVHEITRVLYAHMRDESFHWLVQQVLKNPDNDNGYNYIHILFNISRWSDGFDQKFLSDVIALLRDDSVPLHIRIGVYDSVVRDIPYYREEDVYVLLRDICCWMVDYGLKTNILHRCRSNPRDIISILDRRQAVVDMFASNIIRIPNLLLENVLKGDSKVSKRILGIGINANNIYLLVRLMQNTWGLHGPWELKRMPTQVKHDQILIPSLSKDYHTGLTIKWARDATEGYYYASHISVGVISPPDNDTKEWCGALVQDF